MRYRIRAFFSACCLLITGRLYATLLHRTTAKIPSEQFDESRLKCRYCGFPDVVRCGFRYNARGIARRYRCNECLRKFSIVHIQTGLEDKPSNILWLLNEIGMLTVKLTDLLADLNDRLEVTDLLTKNVPTTPSSKAIESRDLDSESTCAV